MSTEVNISPADLHAMIDKSSPCVVVDVREPFEHAAERIEGAVSHPLSELDTDQLREQHPESTIIFCCRTGRRSHDAIQRFGDSDKAKHLTGGIEAWRAAGLPTQRSPHAPPLDVMRQVQVVAGSLVVLGVVLGVALSPWLLVVSAFVGCGLMFAGLSGWCGMAKLLAIMPWNRLST